MHTRPPESEDQRFADDLMAHGLLYLRQLLLERGQWFELPQNARQSITDAAVRLGRRWPMQTNLGPRTPAAEAERVR